MTRQLPAESYAQAKACLEARADIPSERGRSPGTSASATPSWDVISSQAEGSGDSSGAAVGADGAGARPAPSPFFVVAHVPLRTWSMRQEQASELAGELEHDGLIDTETVQRIACDATVVVAVDDDVGHTMYEGRARRFPTGAQRREVIRRDRDVASRAATNATFANVHHIVPWKPEGRTDLDNLVLLCRHHHGVVHRSGWSMTGNANEELSFPAPRAGS